jgi:hypothetical protein
VRTQIAVQNAKTIQATSATSATSATAARSDMYHATTAAQARKNIPNVVAASPPRYE